MYPASARWSRRGVELEMLDNRLFPALFLVMLTPFLNLLEIFFAVFERRPGLLLVGVEGVCRRRLSWFQMVGPGTYTE